MFVIPAMGGDRLAAGRRAIKIFHGLNGRDGPFEQFTGVAGEPVGTFFPDRGVQRRGDEGRSVRGVIGCGRGVDEFIPGR